MGYKEAFSHDGWIYWRDSKRKKTKWTHEDHPEDTYSIVPRHVAEAFNAHVRRRRGDPEPSARAPAQGDSTQPSEPAGREGALNRLLGTLHLAGNPDVDSTISALPGSRPPPLVTEPSARIRLASVDGVFRCMETFLKTNKKTLKVVEPLWILRCLRHNKKPEAEIFLPPNLYLLPEDFDTKRTFLVDAQKHQQEYAQAYYQRLDSSIPTLHFNLKKQNAAGTELIDRVVKESFDVPSAPLWQGETGYLGIYGPAPQVTFCLIMYWEGNQPESHRRFDAIAIECVDEVHTRLFGSGKIGIRDPLPASEIEDTCKQFRIKYQEYYLSKLNEIFHRDKGRSLFVFDRAQELPDTALQ